MSLFMRVLSVQAEVDFGRLNLPFGQSFVRMGLFSEIPAGCANEGKVPIDLLSRCSSGYEPDRARRGLNWFKASRRDTRSRGDFVITVSDSPPGSSPSNTSYAEVITQVRF